MSTTLAQYTEAAAALVRLLPTPTPLQPVPHSVLGLPLDQMGQAVTASFVGSVSADLAVVLLSAATVSDVAGTDSPAISAADVLRPALEAASSTLGAGVLGDARTDDASSLFGHMDSSVFELRGPEGTAGWFAVRLRSGSAAGTGTEQSVVGKLGRINNVEMALTVEIGRTRMAVRDVLNLEPGRVVELDRSAGAPADILLNGRLIANGEIVVVDQDYAVRITKILDVAEGLG
ncbi:flagellar motor switch protein FliN [Arthrobacter luteolus]|uniref:flagellar motor switch protein FliN n=1 Tax=Arthrobacter luteolus TaxID=98672 RepID=UPI00083325B7|nr:flagellar motor switch protein FliN [Arthrobacter luteolus]